MNSRTLGIIAAGALLLIAALVFLEIRDQGDSRKNGMLLFPGLKQQINDINSVTIRQPGDTAPIVLSNSSGRWVVASRDDYPADIVRIRNILVALADAKIVEEKTANPELFGRLGLTSPDAEGGNGVMLGISLGDTEFETILGNAAQSSYRYARIPGDTQTWLIDKNPEIPKNAGEWLLNELLDIDQTRIRQATIAHADGESIRISRESPDDSGFAVSDIPDGRELSYPTVANGIAGALKDLKLEDIRRDQDSDIAITTSFETFDGLAVNVKSTIVDDETWISLAASSTDANHSEATAINERINGWQFKIADYKADLLTRRWDDILKARAE